MRRTPPEPGLRDGGASKVRTVLSELQERIVHLRRSRIRPGQRMVFAGPLRDVELQNGRRRRGVPNRIGEELQHGVSTGKPRPVFYT